MQNSSQSNPERKHTAPSPADLVATKAEKAVTIDAVSANDETQPTSGEQLSVQDLERAFGSTIVSRLGQLAIEKQQNIIARIESDPRKRALLDSFNSEDFEGNDKTTEVALKWLNIEVAGQDANSHQNTDVEPTPTRDKIRIRDRILGYPAAIIAGLQDRRERKERELSEKIAAEKADLANQGLTDDQYNAKVAEIYKRESRRKKRNFVLGAVATGAVAFGGAVALKFGIEYGPRAAHSLTDSLSNLMHGHSGGGNVDPSQVPNGGGAPKAPQLEMPQPPKAPEIIPGVPTPTSLDQMRHFFDSATDPTTYPDRVGNDFNHPIPSGSNPDAFKLALANQLRGNSHELARYLSVSNIPGVPLEKDFSSQSDYLNALNDYAVKLDGDPKLHFDQFTLLAQKFNAPTTTFSVRDINNAYSSDFFQNGRVGIDDYVPPSGTVTIVDFHDGTEPILVRNECGQTIKEMIEQIKQGYTPGTVQHVAQPEQSTSMRGKPPVINSHVRVEHPPVGGGGHGGGGGGGGHETPPTNLPKNTRADGSNIAQYGDAPRDSGALQNDNGRDIHRPSANYSPGAANANPGTTAPGASETGGNYGGAGAAQAGTNPSPASSGGAESGPSASGGSDGGAQSSRANE